VVIEEGGRGSIDEEGPSLMTGLMLEDEPDFARFLIIPRPVAAMAATNTFEEKQT
jgi:hypothetical protein